MKRAKLELVAFLMAILVMGAAASSPSWFPRGTVLRITPSGYTVESGASLALSASLESGGTKISGDSIRWSVTDGSLDRSTGSNVVFSAPIVNGNESIVITASFIGEGVYQPSTATTQVTVSPAKVKSTTLKVSPTMFEVHSGDTIALMASLSPSDASSQLISWSIDPAGAGSLSSTAGASVNYTAPTFQTNATVTVTASFLGNAQYLASNGSAQGTVLSPEVPLRKPTVVVVSPSVFSLSSNGTIALNANVHGSEGEVLAGETITWTVNPSSAGSLSPGTGASVTYTPSAVDENTIVTITASFAGDGSYAGSRDSSTGTITPKFALSDLYSMTFISAAMTNVTFQGPIVVDGMSVTNITCDFANLSGIRLSHLGLDSSTLVMTNMELYVAYFRAYPPDSNKTIVIAGDQKVSLGPMQSANYVDGVMYVVRMSGTSANLTRMEAVGGRADGSEPYVPSILGSQSATMWDIKNITGPVVYGDPADLVSNITAGTVDILQFSFVHPVTYTLNRTSQGYSSTDRWLLTASSSTGRNVSIYTIYFTLMAHGSIPIIATGDGDISRLIPHGFYTGLFYFTDLEAHAVYFSADELTLNDFMVSIE